MMRRERVREREERERVNTVKLVLNGSKRDWGNLNLDIRDI